MSEPHIPSQPTVLGKDIRQLLSAVTQYIAGTEFEDLIQTAIENDWTLDQAREHIAFMGMELEWYLEPNGSPSPLRYALERLKESTFEDDYEQLDPSLKIIV